MDALFKSQIDTKNDGMTLLQYLVPSIPYLAEEQWLALLKGGAIEIDEGGELTGKLVERAQ